MFSGFDIQDILGSNEIGFKMQKFLSIINIQKI